VLKYGEGAAGTVAQTGEPLMIDNYRTWGKRAGVYEEEQPFTAILSAPMIWHGQVTGVIHVLHDVESRRFTQADLELLTLFANHAAIAVENARLYEQAQREIAERKRAEEVLKHRLLVLSQPAGETSDLRLTDIVDIDVLQGLQDGFAESYAVACLMFDNEGEPITKPSSFSDFCRIVRATKRGMERCEISDASLPRLVADGSSALAPCSNLEEIQDGAVPIFIGDKRVATWGIGQKLTSQLPEDKVRSYAEEIGADPDQLVAAARKLKIGSKEQFKRAMSFLETVANNISLLGLQNLQQAREITTRKRAEEERARLLAQIHEQVQRVQQIMDTVPEGVLLLDADGQVILANPLGRKDLVALANASVGDALTHLGDRPLAELLTSPYHGFWHEVALEGPPPRVFEIIAKPIETGPSPDGWVLVIRDMTREREFQRYSQQQARLATVGQLAAGIAHDFNNIMATIVLYAQMLSQTEDPSPRSRERLATINQQAKHATNLIQQILDFSRRAVLERRPLNLLPLLKEQVKLLERTLPENIQIALAYGPDEYTINADPTRMQQAIMNLAVNARDAMPGGGDLRFGLERVQVQPGESPPLPEMEPGEWVQVTVADTGSGIPPDVLPHIFDPFFTTKAPGEGSGLGLAQVHGIVKQHDGEIGVQSPSTGPSAMLRAGSGQAPSTEFIPSEAEGLRTGQAGHGTTFTIYLPALPVHQPEAPTLELLTLAKGQGETILVTILVVEDDASTRQALVDSLELLNYRTLAAEDGQEALEILERQASEDSNPEVALVLSDVVMPGMGGVALFHALRQRSLAVKVVLMTGHPLEEEMESLRTQELSDWLPKPSNLEQLAQVLARALEEG
jgi:signal transduction histidine kinase/CheY-like chemotaxis protein